MINIFKSVALAAALAVAPVAASAVTVMTNGGDYAISAGSEFIGIVQAGGGAGSWTVKFTSAVDPLEAMAEATIGPIQAGTFTGLTMSWLGSDGLTSLFSAPVAAPDTLLTTIFTLPNLTQFLQLSWENSLEGAGFDVEVSAVPVPAAGLLLLGGLGALAAVRRNKQNA